MLCTGYKAASDRDGLPARPWDTARNSVGLVLMSHSPKTSLRAKTVKFGKHVIERNMHTCYHSLLIMFSPSVAVIYLFKKKKIGAQGNG